MITIVVDADSGAKLWEFPDDLKQVKACADFWLGQEKYEVVRTELLMGFPRPGRDAEQYRCISVRKSSTPAAV